MKRYTFDVLLCGSGDTPEEAWQSAIEGFMDNPGPCPEDEYTLEEED
jgi:hypothetical protein